jgi:ER membrane protein complex subunit 7
MLYTRYQFRVDVPPEPESSPEVHPYTVGTPLNPPSPVKLPHPVKLVPRQRKSYFVPHQSFNVMQMFQNPMMLIMVFGGLMMLAMPYITVSTSLTYYLSLWP